MIFPKIIQGLPQICGARLFVFGKHIFLFSIFYFLSSASAFAVTAIYFDVPRQVEVGQEFSAAVFLDSDDPINAYSLEVLHSSGILPVTFDWRNSVFELRQGQPRSTGIGGVFFEGASLSPFSGQGGKVIVLGFRALEEGSAELGFGRADIFIADGKGTKIDAESRGARLEILPERTSAEDTRVSERDSGGSVLTVAPDVEPPEIRELSLFRDPFGENMKILGFLVVDGGSGVGKVEARIRRFVFWEEWSLAQSPVSVSKDVWSVAVRASDLEGNVTQKTVYDWGAFSRMTLPILLAFAALASVLLFFFRRSARRKLGAENI